jgi:hypothetical protein
MWLPFRRQAASDRKANRPGTGGACWLHGKHCGWDDSDSSPPLSPLPTSPLSTSPKFVAAVDFTLTCFSNESRHASKRW